MFRPSRRTFRSLSRSGRWVPVAASFPQEASPQVLFEALRPGSPRVLLESARLHPVTGRYSFIAGEPRLVMLAKGRQVRLEGPAGVRKLQGDPFAVLQQLLDERPAARLPGLPPFVGGAVGFVGFDACRLLEDLPSRAEDDFPLPDLGFLFCDDAVVVDHLWEKVWVIALAAPGDDRSYDRAVARVEELADRISCPEEFQPWVLPPVGPLPSVPAHCLAGLANPVLLTHRTASLVQQSKVNRTAGAAAETSPRRHPWPEHPAQATHTRENFERMVRTAKRFIASGDIYQANLSQRFVSPVREEPWVSYRRLTALNPSPFACYAEFPSAAPGGLSIVSSSPERLLRVRRGVAETRPIAGTRPKGASAVETARLRRELILNEKERAEHLMLVDLERNDLGRVCRYGSVKVDDLMAMEEYSHVIHIVSNVRGRLREGARLPELFAAAFPGGTISGCPKVRSLEIIDGLEPVRRQLYTGSMGYVSATGEMDFNILIRTGFVRGGQVAIQAGAGIVADSDPGREYDETLHKARALREVFEGVIASDQRERSKLQISSQ